MLFTSKPKFGLLEGNLGENPLRKWPNICQNHSINVSDFTVSHDQLGGKKKYVWSRVEEIEIRCNKLECAGFFFFFFKGILHFT